MKTVEFTVGACVGNAYKAIWELAQDGQCAAMGVFNDVPIVSFFGDSLDDVENRFTYLSNQSHDAYRRTNLSKERMVENAKRGAEERRKAEELIDALSWVEKSDLPGIMEIIRDSHILGTFANADLAAKFVELLESKGFKPNVNCGKDFNGDDPQNHAEWIIGQAMTMPGHGIENKFANDWLAKFAGEPHV